MPLSRFRICLLAAYFAVSGARSRAQDLNAIRDDQLNRLKTYIADAVRPNGLVRDALQLSPGATNFHPATPDAAGFALLGISGLEHVGKFTTAAAEELAIRILSAHTGHTVGVVPDRSADGHFIHFMNIGNGNAAGGGWDDSYSPISSALLVTGAQFAKRHFSDNAQIAALADELTASVDFNAAIRSNLNGQVFLDMTKAGGGNLSSLTSPWNEYALVVSRALREPNNARARAVEHRWFDPDFLPKATYQGVQTLTDVTNSFRPAFLVQQSHYFNGDFRFTPELEAFYTNQQIADELYSTSPAGLNQAFRYGITAGVDPLAGYHADAIFNNPDRVFSPSAVVGWGDLDTMLDFYAQQIPTSNSRYRYGLVRVSSLAGQTSWIPSDAALVDHLFLLFGLIESLDPQFFAERIDPPFAAADFNRDGVVDGSDVVRWGDRFGAASGAIRSQGDADSDDDVDGADFLAWQRQFADPTGAAAPIPEPSGLFLASVAAGGIAAALRHFLAKRRLAA